MSNVIEITVPTGVSLSVDAPSDVEVIEVSSGVGPQGPAGADGAQGPPGNDGAQGPPGVDGTNGADGASAYNVAVSEGFVGDETAWLASLVGPVGSQGPPGVDGSDGVPGVDGSDGVPGADGASAYEVAVAGGFVGNEAAWLASLVGADGADGAPGSDGLDGAPGVDGASAYDIAVSNGFVGTEAEWVDSMSTVNASTDVDVTGLANGQSLVWDANGSQWVPSADAVATTATATGIAAGSTLGLQQELLAAQGQVGKTVLAVPYTFYQGSEGPSANHKVQGTSLGDGNVLFVYASGADFAAGNIQEGPVFLADGEIYVIENVQAGTIITATEGFYGFAQQRNGNDESPMPLLSLALSFVDSFCYAFRNSQTYAPGTGTAAQGFIHVVNGPLASEVTLTRNGVAVQGQEGIPLDPWEYRRFYTEANGEYRLVGTNSIMTAINAEMDTTTPRFFDSRLVLPTANDIVSWPRSGFVSAPYDNTVCRNYVNDKTQSGLAAGDTFTVSGAPVDWDGATGANDADYEPRGATRLIAEGLVSAYSGADTSGLEASPACPVFTMTQKIALPLHIRNSGDGGNNGIHLASPYTGTARVYEWDKDTRTLSLVSFGAPGGGTVTEIPLVRREGASVVTASTAAEQLHPASASISAQGGDGGSDPGAYDLLADFNGGYVVVDVPCICVFNSEQNENGGSDHVFRGTSGDNVVGIHSDDDEQLSYGITPEEIRLEVRRNLSDGLLYKHVIATGGPDTWEVA